ncbi:VPS10 domain-containing protein [Flavicella sediminum]|uniref:VPS10 domain-containing protein n=1 Tax=Flavicella sediminum TaxID=2585141 RepID=UPI00140BD777|nr:sialidase family protein [Flavicella sediminum]
MKTPILFLLVLMQIVAFGQTSNYFKKLQTQKVPSNPSVKWTVIGPGTSGYSEELNIHPYDSNVMFLNYDMGNGYGTWNKGDSWTTLNEYDGLGSKIKPFKTAFSVTNHDFGIMKGAAGTVYTTNNRGRNWIEIKNFPSKKKFNAVAIDPKNDAVWYIGAGQHWRVKGVHRSLKEPHGTKYRNTEYGFIYKTTDAGKTWEKIMNNISKDLDILRILVDPRDSTNLYVLTNFGFYVSNDAGASWKEKKLGLPFNDARDLQSYYNAKTGAYYLYLLLQTHYKENGQTTKALGGVYKSENNGEDWISISGNLDIDMTQISDYSSKNYYYKTIAYWFGISVKEAKTKFPNFPKSTMPVYNRIVVNPINPNEVYISNNIKHDMSFSPAELMKTEDGGENWFVCARAGNYWKNGKDKVYWDSRNNPTGNNMSFAHLDATANGEGSSKAFRDLQINAEGEVFTVYDQQLFLSKDHGKTWQQRDDIETAPGSGHWVGRGNSNLPGFGLNVQTKMKGQYLFASEEHGIWRSTTDGDQVYKGAVALKQIEGQALEVNHYKAATSAPEISIDPNNANVYYILPNRQHHAGHLRKSVDAGKTWFNISEKPMVKFNPNGVLFLFSHIIDKKDSNRMLFSIPSHTQRGWHTSKWMVNGYLRMTEFNDFGVHLSSDGGKTWKTSNKGLPNRPNVMQMTYDEDYKNIYAGLGRSFEKSEGGLYKSKDDGESWNKVKIPQEIKSVNFVEIDKNGIIYLACGEGGAAINDGGVYRSSNKGKSWEKIFEMPHIKMVKISPLDAETIAVIVAPGKKVKELNSGIYISKNNGKNWTKINYGLGQVDKMTGFEFDPYDENVFWSSCHGSGFAKGVYKR